MLVDNIRFQYIIKHRFNSIIADLLSGAHRVFKVDPDVIDLDYLLPDRLGLMASSGLSSISLSVSP